MTATRMNSSRERILSCAEALVLQKGFAGTSIEEIIDKSAITKGGFFYHFKGKSDLAKALVNRYLVQDDAIFNDLFEQADSLSEDPLHQLLIFLKLFAQMMENLAEAHPGCLVAGFTYESQQFDEEVTSLIRMGTLSWRNLIAERLKLIEQTHNARCEYDIEEVADMFTSTIEGGIILSRIFDNKMHLVEQINLYRTHIRLLFNDV